MPSVLSTPLDTFQWFGGSSEQRIVFWTCAALLGQFGLAAVTLLSGVNAPYGRYNQAHEKASKTFVERCLASFDVPSKVAWVIQESPTLIAAAWCWAIGDAEIKRNPGNVACLSCFVLHYINRTLIFPFRSKGSKPIPLPVMLMATGFCAVNGYLQCRSLTNLMTVDASSWTTPVGCGLWALGLYINMDADDRLRNLRKPGETGYKIPRGGAFEYVSGANFFGEMVEWSGYALATGMSLPGLTFAVCTACNIGPRAVAHHKWYLDKFKGEYPKERKAVFPFIY